MENEITSTIGDLEDVVVQSDGDVKMRYPCFYFISTSFGGCVRPAFVSRTRILVFFTIQFGKNIFCDFLVSEITCDSDMIAFQWCSHH